MRNYFDLGDYERSITSAHGDAQTWFNRGLVWCYAFNQEEAVRCFEKVVELDPKCAMGYWGMAYAAGPFYNKPWAWYGQQERGQAVAYCHQQASKALALIGVRIAATGYMVPGIDELKIFVLRVAKEAAESAK